MITVVLWGEHLTNLKCAKAKCGGCREVCLSRHSPRGECVWTEERRRVPQDENKQKVPALASRLNFHTMLRGYEKNVKPPLGPIGEAGDPGKTGPPSQAGATHPLQMQAARCSVTAEAWAAGNNLRISEQPDGLQVKPAWESGLRTTLPEPRPHGSKTHCPVARTQLSPTCSEPCPVLSTLCIQFIT